MSVEYFGRWCKKHKQAFVCSTVKSGRRYIHRCEACVADAKAKLKEEMTRQNNQVKAVATIAIRAARKRERETRKQLGTQIPFIFGLRRKSGT